MGTPKGDMGVGAKDPKQRRIAVVPLTLRGERRAVPTAGG
jgi:hypothetical protein